MKLVAVLCGFIGIVQFVFTHSPLGLVWIVAAIVLFLIDRHYGD